MTMSFKKNLFVYFFTCLLLSLDVVLAQTNSSQFDTDTKFKLFPSLQYLQASAFIDTYYAYDFNTPNTHERGFTTTAARHNEFNLNLAMVDVNYNDNKKRGRLALQWGTSVVKNYNAEPLSGQSSSDARTIYGIDSRTIQEGFVGFRISDKTWIDAGIFYSTIGMETWVSKYNFNYTRVLFSDYVPYYSSGIKISHEFNSSFLGELHLINGWQVVQDDNQEKSLSWKLDKKLNMQFNIIYNGHAGKERGVFTESRLKTYHNLIVKYLWSNGHETHTAFDIGTTETQVKKDTDQWMVWALAHNMPLTEKLNFAIRGEIYRDPHNAHIPTSSTNQLPFNVYGLTGTINYKKEENLLLRLEGRYLSAEDAVFQKNVNQPTKENFVMIQSIALTI
jgi:hypothetical protein